VLSRDFRVFQGFLFFERFGLILGGEFLDRTQSVPIA
jgi:hypothetical protein